MLNNRLIAIPSLALLASLGLAQTDPATVERIVDQGKNHSQIMDRFHYMCFNIGARLTSSPELYRGQLWALDQFTRFGCTNVHLEKWGEFPVGFDRGPLQVAKMVEPFESDMVFTTPAWSNGTQGIVRAEVIKFPASLDELKAHEADFKGKWVLMPPPGGPPSAPGDPGYSNFRAPRPAGAVTPGGPGGTAVAGRRRAGPVGAPGAAGTAGATAGAAQRRGGAQNAPNAAIVAELEQIGIAGRISGSRNELVVTNGPRWNQVTFEKHPGAPQVLVRRSDYDRLERNIYLGRKVVVEIGAENRWFKGPVPAYNVVADIKGTEKPNEIVIVSGHFDSWNGPGSQGAQDNGKGAMAAMEAARILCAAHAKPKRTIRFILWSGEEEGLFGSTNYVKMHPDQLPNISAVLVDDGGANYQGGYGVLKQMQPMMEDAIQTSNEAFPDMPEAVTVINGTRMPRGGGSDHVPFNAVGVPGFFTRPTGTLDYTYVHHTQHDRFETVIPKYMVQSATNHALVSYFLACAPTMLPREEPASASN